MPQLTWYGVQSSYAEPQSWLALFHHFFAYARAPAGLYADANTATSGELTYQRVQTRTDTAAQHKQRQCVGLQTFVNVTNKNSTIW